MDSSSSIEKETFELIEKVRRVISNLFELKRTNKIYSFDNEHVPALDRWLKTEFCPTIELILQHGLKKDFQTIKRNHRQHLWKIIESSLVDHSRSIEIPFVYLQAKQSANNLSSHWRDRFNTFLFVLLNRNELINWLYFFTRQKRFLQRYYQSPSALILLSLPQTFNHFERMMCQLEKLSSLSFHLTYHSILPPTSTADWTSTLSRRFTSVFSHRTRLTDTFNNRRSVSPTSRTTTIRYRSSAPTK